MKRWQHYRWLWSLDSLLVCVRMINDRTERKIRMKVSFLTAFQRMFAIVGEFIIDIYIRCQI